MISARVKINFPDINIQNKLGLCRVMENTTLSDWKRQKTIHRKLCFFLKNEKCSCLTVINTETTFDIGNADDRQRSTEQT